MKIKSIFLTLFLLLFSYLIHAKGVHFTLISQTNQEIIVRVDFPEYTTIPVQVEGEEMYQLLMSQAYPVQEKGAPELLKSATSLIIPEGVQPIMELISSDFSLISDFKLAPSKGVLYRDVNPSTIPFVKGEQYLKDRFMQNEPVHFGEIYQLRDLMGVPVIVYPFDYNPVKQELKAYHSLVVKISYDSPVTNMIRAPKNNRVFDQIYANHFLNYENAVVDRYTALSEEGEMLIIAPADFIPALQPLKEWKIKTGIPTTIVSVTTAGNSTTAIKSYIQNFYNTHNLAYVIIVGDNQQFPVYYVGGSPSDNFYVEVAGGDSYPDILLGKISAENVSQVNVQVDKFIRYDQGLLDQSHHSTYAGIASYEGPGHNGEYDHEHIRNINQLLNSYTYDNGYEFFEGSQGGLDAPGHPTASMVANAVNSGVGLINYCGHGDYDMFITSGFSNYNVTQLSNSEKLPFIISVACQNGNYVSRLCFAEAWLRATKNGKPTGAVGALMSTINQPWNAPMTAQDKMNEIITNTSPNQTRKTFGAIAFGGIMHMLDMHSDYSTARTWVLFSDPSIMIRTDEAVAITATHPSILPLTSTQIVVNSPVEGAYVALSLQDQVIGTGTIQGGTATITLPTSLNNNDTVRVVITKMNHIPYQGQFVILSSEEPLVIYTDHQFFDNQGNKVEKLKTGGNYTMTMSLFNIGLQASSQINVRLTLNNPFVSLQNGNLQVQSINGLTEYIISNQFQVYVSPQVPYGTIAEFVLEIEDEEETRYFYFNEQVAAPSLFTGDLLVDDHTSGGNNNGVIDYGERVHLVVPVENFGDAPAEPGLLKLESLRNHLSVYRTLSPVGEILPLQVENNHIEVSVKPSVYQPCVDLVRITYLSGQYSYQRVYEVSIAGGTSSIDEVTADQLLIYPNPTADQLNLVLSEQRMEGDLNYVICNSVGAVVSRGTILDTRTTINVESLTTGFYFIQILQNNNLIFNQKIIKK